MVLVDTSVWVTHFRTGKNALPALLDGGDVACHPFVIGELACGILEPREEILAHLSALPSATVAAHAEILTLIEERSLQGRGLGYVDVHLLASALLSGLPLWTTDRALREIARDLEVDYVP